MVLFIRMPVAAFVVIAKISVVAQFAIIFLIARMLAAVVTGGRRAARSRSNVRRNVGANCNAAANFGEMRTLFLTAMANGFFDLFQFDFAIVAQMMTASTFDVAFGLETRTFTGSTDARQISQGVLAFENGFLFGATVQKRGIFRMEKAMEATTMVFFFRQRVGGEIFLHAFFDFVSQRFVKGFSANVSLGVAAAGIGARSGA